MTADVIEIIYNPEDISKRIAALAQDIANSDFDDLLVVSILKGSFMFAADLMRALHGAGLKPSVDFLMLASYRSGTVSSGSVEILRDISTEVKGHSVLIIDDILESGRTLAFAKDLIAARGAERVATCVLLDKPVERAVNIEADFCAFQCPNVFVVGYGMDLDHRYRELPFVGRIVQD